ncbi:MAG TPA: biotin/lipoyl-binding protein [Pirellulales bacterium]|nr:biotin/lipoyl-binding protein [Pirellulales bacterium]
MSSASSAFDPELIDQTRQQLRTLVHEIEGLSRSELSPGEFYEGFLNRVVSALAAVGGAIWSLDESGRFKLIYQMNLKETRLAESEAAQQQHGLLLRNVAGSGQGALIAPHSGTGEAGQDGNTNGDGVAAANPTDFLLVLGALKSDKEVQGVVEIFQRPGSRPTVERGYLRFLSQMCELAGDYLKTRNLRLFADRQLMWSQLELFTRLAHESLDPKQAAYTIANEGRRLIGCDRVTVALRNGKKCRVVAVSGQETIDQRSNTVSQLGKLATVVVAGGDPLWYTGDTANLPPQIEKAVESYADEAHSKLVAVLPLARPQPEPEENELDRPPPDFLGALIVEQISEDTLTESMRRRVDVVSEHSSLALANAREHNDLFLMPVWRSIGKLSWIVQARTLPKTLAIAGAVLVLLIAMFVLPWKYELSGKGTLEPVNRQDIFAGVDGVVEQIKVHNGQSVKKGDVLLKLRNEDLGAQITKVAGDLAVAEVQQAAAERALHDAHLTREDRDRLDGQARQYGEAARSAEQQLELLRNKEDELTIRSPIAGEVITWQIADKLLNRPVERGQLLLTVADPTKAWELEVHMPEDRMGAVVEAQNQLDEQKKKWAAEGKPKPDAMLPVSFILATDPGNRHQGLLKEIHKGANVMGEEGNVVLLRVKIQNDGHDLGLTDVRPGATVTAKVDCGKASLGYVLFHDVIAFIQSKVLFRF